MPGPAVRLVTAWKHERRMMQRGIETRWHHLCRRGHGGHAGVALDCQCPRAIVSHPEYPGQRWRQNGRFEGGQTGQGSWMFNSSLSGDGRQGRQAGGRSALFRHSSRAVVSAEVSTLAAVQVPAYHWCLGVSAPAAVGTPTVADAKPRAAVWTVVLPNPAPSSLTSLLPTPPFRQADSIHHPTPIVPLTVPVPVWSAH